ncbi:uncharacterized protein LOC118196766 isoform X2 [Stegodyphus dumicola]|uniref:uncharacterized protein LOC118196766 isoform X2 n=1 Tax=Stegodyphus dumicola TaxID=202533 RepID=UPI0015AB86EA|nr:uncharacterized protein LOC118196766 isoform X2 [Stegodyphus dumicola]
MWKLITILLTILGAVKVAITCDSLEQCFEDLNESFEALDVALPTENDLKRMCPLARKSFSCFHGKIELCTGMTTAERALLKHNEIASNAAQTLLNMENMANDLCDNKSILHKSYVQSVTCANEYFATQEENFRRKGSSAHEAYKELQNTLPEESDNGISIKEECLIQAFSLMCLSEDLQKCRYVSRLMPNRPRYSPGISHPSFSYRPATQEDIRLI